MERGAHKVFDRHRAVGQKKIAQVKAAGPGDAAHAEKRDEQIDLFPEAVRRHRNENGGIYFDTDVEVLKSFDRFLSDEFFVGFEEKAFVGTCVMGAQKGAPILKEYMAHYENAAYLNEDGTKYSDTNVLLLTRLLEEKGLERNDKEQTVDGYIKIYPRTFFSPYDYIDGINYITDDSYSIHHFTLSWLPKSTRIKTGIKRKIIKIIGGENIKKIREKLG